MSNKTLLLVLVLFAGCTAPEQIPYLFVKTDKMATTRSARDMAVTNVINVSDIKLGLLRDSGVRKIKLPIPGGEDIVIRLDSTKKHPSYMDWIGKVEDDKTSLVYMSFTDKALYGRITTGKDLFRINYAGNGVYQVAKLDQSKMLETDEDATAVKPDSTRKSMPRAKDCADPTNSIDVLVVYTGDAEAATGGPDAMTALINLSVSMTNDAYLNSGVGQHINLVHTEKVDYVESGSAQTDRDALQNPSDGVLDNVPTLRNIYSADLVVMLVDSLRSPNNCGMAFIPDPIDPSQEAYGYAVVSRHCAVDNLSFPHELAHLMGARHEGDPKTTPYPYGHGFVDLTPSDGTPPWQTIMSKVQGPTRQPFFSNPDRRFPPSSGDPTGTADKADNRQVLNNTAPVISQYRCSSSALQDSAKVRAYKQKTVEGLRKFKIKSPNVANITTDYIRTVERANPLRKVVLPPKSAAQPGGKNSKDAGKANDSREDFVYDIAYSDDGKTMSYYLHCGVTPMDGPYTCNVSDIVDLKYKGICYQFSLYDLIQNVPDQARLRP